MKKLLTFLLVAIIFTSLNVKADGWINSRLNKSITYRKELNGVVVNRYAGVFKTKANNRLVYCIEPMVDVNLKYKYSSVSIDKASQITNISIETLEKVNLAAFYGYGYKDRVDDVWFQATQLLIWRLLEPSGKFYFTNGLHGAKKEAEEAKIKAILDDVNKHLNKIKVKNIKDLSIKKDNVLTSEGASFDDYLIEHDKDLIVKSEGNNLKVKSDKEGTFELKLKKKEKNVNFDPVIYYHDTSQNIIAFGKYNDLEEKLQVNFIKGSLKIIKEDLKTKDKAQGEASLSGTTFEIEGEGGLKLTKTVDDKGQILIEDLPLGTYKIKEIKAGNGYELNKETYEVIIDNDNLNKEITIKNKVIEKTFDLQKYKKDATLTGEADIKFDIYNKDGEKVKTVITNEEGKTNFTLPYGNYKVKQINTTPGYSFVKDFEISALESGSERLELINIKVPNAGAFDYRPLIIMLLLSLTFINEKKSHKNRHHN